MSSYESVKRPAHYESRSGQQLIHVIHDYGLSFCSANVLKYLVRAGKKPGEDRLKDLRKALEYIQFEIQFAEQDADQQLPPSDVSNDVLDLADSAVIGSNMPAGFRPLQSDLCGLAAYTCGVHPLSFGVPPFRADSENTDLGAIYETVSEQLTDLLPRLSESVLSPEDLAELTDLLCQARLFIAHLPTFAAQAWIVECGESRTPR